MEAIQQPVQQKQVQQEQGIPLGDALDDIEAAAKDAIETVSNIDPRVLAKLGSDGNTTLDESGFKNLLASIAIAGIGALSALPAQAQTSLGETLAVCSGQFLVLSKLNQMGGDMAGSKAMVDAWAQSMELSKNLIGYDNANRISIQERHKIENQMKAGDPNAIKRVSANMQNCANSIVKVEQAIKQQSQPKSQASTQVKSNDGGGYKKVNIDNFRSANSTFVGVEIDKNTLKGTETYYSQKSNGNVTVTGTFVHHDDNKFYPHGKIVVKSKTGEYSGVMKSGRWDGRVIKTDSDGKKFYKDFNMGAETDGVEYKPL